MEDVYFVINEAQIKFDLFMWKFHTCGGII